MTRPMQPPADYQWRSERAAAERFASAISTYQGLIGLDGILARQWLAVGLATGECTGPYDSREAGWRNSTNRPERMFIYPVPLERMGPEACDVLLWYVRQCYDNGWREDGRSALILPGKNEDLRRTL